MGRASRISRVEHPRNLAVSTMLAKEAMFSEPVALRVPRRTLRKITSGRRARSAWLVVGGPPQPTRAKTSGVPGLRGRGAYARSRPRCRIEGELDG